MADSTTMYRLPPIIPANMEFDLPTRMYKLPVINNFGPQEAEISKDDLQALNDLEKRQENILNQLENLKLEVDKLKISPGKSSGKPGTKDIVIRATPQHAPNVLPLLCNQLMANGLKIFTSSHVHSSFLNKIPNELVDFLPNSNCSSRSEADLCVTLIWKDVGKDMELVTSPTSTAVIKGEVNLLRYVSRRFNVFSVNELDEITIQVVENLLDTFHAEKWSSGSNISSVVENSLKKSQFLAKKFSLADIYAMSMLKKTKNNKPILEWLKRCDLALKQASEKPKSRPRLVPRSRQTSTVISVSESNEIRVGGTLKHQWPQIKSVYLAKESTIEMLRDNPISVVSEKLDGSNLSVASNGIIASRRQILLVDPKPEDLNRTKFCGEPLSSLKSVLDSAKNMQKQFFQKEISPNKVDFNVLIFGEWIQKGTASSSSDKFKYQDRKIECGKLYGFGVCLTFPNDSLDDSNLTKFQNVLTHKGFSVAVEKEKNSDGKYLVILLNAELKHLFDRFKISTVPILQTLPFAKIFKNVYGDLLAQSVEGFVITVPCKGAIFKWKGYEDNDPRRVESLIEISEKSKNVEALDPLNKVLQESLLYNAHGRKRYFDPNLVDAFNSARSKFPRLDDILCNAGDPEQKAKLIEGYKFTLVEEITKDFGKAFGCDKEAIRAFVNQEVKP